MSFDDLPHCLKSCFLYLGALPETKMHEGHKLVRLWISEGFIKPKKGRTLEEIAQQHLKELVSQCLVQLVHKDAQVDVGSIVVHNPVHAFVQAEAQEANFFEIHDNVDVIAPSTVRHLSIQNHTNKYVPLSKSFPKLRSLICDFAEKQDNTQVLAPQNNQTYHTLRYLGVKNCGLKQLPTSICNLIYLQTFDVQDTDAKNVAGTPLALLEKANNLRSLQLEGLSNLHSDALLVALRKLELLVHLKLKCSKEASIPLRIFNISILCRLQSLEIDGRLEKVQEQESMDR
ncbi:hypothetical protein FCM35_KLT13668 [Carex littledalei]|uniref:Disease resistance protein winged helix domain-containing protein n=1 Tax=Carex littledalei TaxID=544730 RepID=A0A833V3N8_9POAL|nr:hypothetical protein FCM35_KLT13668 [Carex littledalei]